MHQRKGFQHTLYHLYRYTIKKCGFFWYAVKKINSEMNPYTVNPGFNTCINGFKVYHIVRNPN